MLEPFTAEVTADFMRRRVFSLNRYTVPVLEINIINIIMAKSQSHISLDTSVCLHICGAPFETTLYRMIKIYIPDKTKRRTRLNLMIIHPGLVIFALTLTGSAAH